MKNEFLLREEFKSWLMSNGKFPLPSANSYLSYVAGADKRIEINDLSLKLENSNLFEILKIYVKKGNSLAVDETIISVVDELYSEGIEYQLETPISTIQKWRSALFQYREFLYDYIETVIEPTIELELEEDFVENESYDDFTFEESSQTEIIVNSAQNKHIESHYPKKDLYDIFRNRLISQDRGYKQIFYPISFIKRLFYLKNQREYFDNWIIESMDKVILHFAEGNLSLGEISKLSIVKGNIFVSHKGRNVMLLTKLADNKTLAPFKIELLKHVSIDHERPMLNIMTENLKNLPTLILITTEFKKHITGSASRKKLLKVNSIVINSDFVNQVNLEALKNELELLSSKITLQLMDGRENLIKKIVDNL